MSVACLISVSILTVFAYLQLISGLSVYQALTPSSFEPPTDDVITTNKALCHLPLPWVPASKFYCPRFPVPVLPPFWGSRWWRKWRKRRKGRGWYWRPRSKPIWWFALFFPLLLLAGRTASVSHMASQTESSRALGNPQYGATQCTKWSWEKHPGKQESAVIRLNKMDLLELFSFVTTKTVISNLIHNSINICNGCLLYFIGFKSYKSNTEDTFKQV